ncbi:armadillo-type protein [Radiomyces spectabilis]|uniref:armadillo-type protein n=1 Tax=Radiomyces spectabilis TaxID=64574 RepID=UPI00222019B2|nr:armadillo-type protein [Radiomyces spectabilis]KAI8366037.1 armadillo-type protein [Radiomyces spectabilis]
MSGTNAYMVANLLEKMSNEDRDFRYMAVNDLINELQKDTFSLEPMIEGKVVRAVLALMDDKNSEVQNLAVKCLGPLVKQIKEEQTLDIIDRLSDFASQPKNEELRGIASIGLKSVILEVSPHSGYAVCQKFVPKLLHMLQLADASYEMQIDTLDILAEILSRFGSQMTADQQARVQSTLLPLLDHNRAAIRKRATTALGYLVVHTNDELFSDLFAYILKKLQTTRVSTEKLRTFVQCTGVLSRFSAPRLGKHLLELMPIIVKETAGEDDELREICLQSLESFVIRCPTEIGPFIGEIISLGLQYLKYDPNYALDEDEEGDDADADADNDEDKAMDEDSEDEDDDEEYENVLDYSDDDEDMSWKARRASAKLLGTIIETRIDLLPKLYQTVAPALIQRFKEHEESVQVDVLHTFIVLLKQTSFYAGDDTVNLAMTDDHGFEVDVSGCGEEMAIKFPKRQTPQPDNADMETSDSPKYLLRTLVPKLSRALAKQLRAKSTQTRQTGFRLLREVVYVLHGGLQDQIEQFIPAIETSLSTSSADQHHLALSSNLKIEILAFLRLFLRNHSPKSLHPYLNRLCPAVIQTISDKFYKITSESFLVCIELIKVIRPIVYDSKAGQYDIEPMNMDYMPYISAIYDATINVLNTSDADQEVKERSVMCLAALLAQTGDVLEAKQHEAWNMLLERLRNEVTRIISVRSLAIVCQSPVAAGKELERCVLSAVDDIALLLRKSNRALRITSLECLTILIKRFGEHIPMQSYDILLQELKPLISDVDLHLLPLALTTIKAVITVQPGTIQQIKASILPSLFQLIQSPLLQGSALESLLSLLASLAKASPNDYDLLIKGLVDPLLNVQTTGVSAGGVAAVANKQAASAVAQCVAVLAVNNSETNRDQTIQHFQSYIESPAVNDSIKYLSLLTLGEIGRRVHLKQDFHEQILSLFSAQSEEVKFAAAFALGNVAVGNIGKYLPLIVGQIREQPKRRYLLLHALKEASGCLEEEAALGSASDEIWNLLLEGSESDQEEGTRTVVAECLGKLALTNPKKFLPQLEERLSSPTAHSRATVATAVKYAVVDPSQEHDDLLRPIIARFLNLLQDPDLNVRRLTLLTINSAIHRKPYLVRNVLPQLIPLLYDETVIKEELIHTVEMGPFKHKVDDGLEVRKAAYECMYALLSTCLEKIDVYEFLNRVRAGLDDQHDIKMLTNLTLIRLSKMAPTAVSQKLDDLVIPMKSTLDFKMRSNAVKQEVEKNQELVRATLRCMVALSALTDTGAAPTFDSFLREVKMGPLAEEYKLTLVEVENRENRAADYMDLS